MWRGGREVTAGDHKGRPYGEMVTHRRPPGGTSNRGAAAPLIGRFKGWGVGAGEIEIPRPDPFFPAAFFGKKAVPPEAPAF